MGSAMQKKLESSLCMHSLNKGRSHVWMLSCTFFAIKMHVSSSQDFYAGITDTITFLMAVAVHEFILN